MVLSPGRTLTVSGRMPACLASVRTSAVWSGVARVTTVPPAPARAVRPDLCRYALCSVGGSTCTTSATSSTWMPRAAMSVATSTRVLPSVNAARLRSRAFWLRLPCSSTAGTPAAVSCLASFLAVCLVRMNSRLRSCPLASSRTTAALSTALTANT